MQAQIYPPAKRHRLCSEIDKLESREHKIRDLTTGLSAIFIKPSQTVDQLELAYNNLNQEVEYLSNNFVSNTNLTTKKHLLQIAKVHFETAYWNEWEQNVEKTPIIPMFGSNRTEEEWDKLFSRNNKFN